MQNFLELTGIDTSNRLVVRVELVVHGTISYEFSVNGEVLDGLSFVGYYDLFDPLVFSCNVTSLIHGNSGVEINCITVNGYGVMPLYQHHSTKSTNYLDVEGLWELRVPGPFNSWYHEISGQGWVA